MRSFTSGRTQYNQTRRACLQTATTVTLGESGTSIDSTWCCFLSLSATATGVHDDLPAPLQNFKAVHTCQTRPDKLQSSIPNACSASQVDAGPFSQP